MEFEYTCIDTSAKEFKGTLSAADINEAKVKLKGMGLVVVALGEKAGRSRTSFRSRGKIKDHDIYYLAKEMSVLMNAGINIDKALELLTDSVSNIQLKGVVQQILRDVKSGKTLSDACEQTKRFHPLFNIMIRVGESTGDLKTAFENISQYMNFQIRFKSEIKNSMTYPLFLIFASMAILVVIFKLIIPRFFSIFGQNTASLPLISRALYAVSSMMSTANIVVVLVAAGVAIVLTKQFNYKVVFRRLYGYLLYLPLFRNLIINLELSRFAYSMYSMLRSGVEFIKALALSKDVVLNANMRSELSRTMLQIREGKGIAEAFSHVSFMPAMMIGMVKVGESSGNLKEIFFELYTIFDEKFKNAMKRILVLLEPAVITVMGIIVGIIVISLILTVMSVSNIKL